MTVQFFFFSSIVNCIKIESRFNAVLYKMIDGWFKLAPSCLSYKETWIKSANTIRPKSLLRHIIVAAVVFFVVCCLLLLMLLYCKVMLFCLGKTWRHYGGRTRFRQRCWSTNIKQLFKLYKNTNKFIYILNLRPTKKFPKIENKNKCICIFVKFQ